MPKQYLPLRGQPIATWSLQTFAAMKASGSSLCLAATAGGHTSIDAPLPFPPPFKQEVGEIVVVCDPSYRDIFEGCPLPRQLPLKWALPGKERQDSVYNGLQEVRSGAALVAVHDSARPMVEAADVRRCIQDAAEVGAAVLGVQVKPTIKEVDPNGRVIRTLDRSKLWEVQTPQIIRPELLKRGYDKARREEAAAPAPALDRKPPALLQVNKESLAVTDDVSIIEHLGHPVKITVGDYTNIKARTTTRRRCGPSWPGEMPGACQCR